MPRISSSDFLYSEIIDMRRWLVGWFASFIRLPALAHAHLLPLLLLHVSTSIYPLLARLSVSRSEFILSSFLIATVPHVITKPCPLPPLVDPTSPATILVTRSSLTLHNNQPNIHQASGSRSRYLAIRRGASMGGEVEYKWGLLSLLELPIGERHFELVALMLGILVCVDFCWELLNDILEHVRVHPAVATHNEWPREME